MTIYYITFTLSLLLGFLLLSKEIKIYPFYRKDNTYLRVFISMLPLTLVALLRWNVGVDVVYGKGYYFLEYSAIQNGYGNLLDYEWGFYLLMEICNFLHMHLYFFYGVITLVFMLSVIWFMYRNSTNIVFSIILFFSSDLYLFSFSTLRQAMGIAISLYLINEFYKNKRLLRNWKVWISALLAISMHYSSFYLLLVLIISKIRFTKKSLLKIVLAGCLLSPFLKIFLKQLLTLTVYFTKYTGSKEFLNEFTPTYFLLALIIFIPSYTLYDKLISQNENNYILINVSAILVVLMLNSSVLIMPYRIFPLFISFYMLLCPALINCFKQRDMRIIMFFYIIIPFLYAFINQHYAGDSYNIYTYETIFNNMDVFY